jgi:hypothetical protein
MSRRERPDIRKDPGELEVKKATEHYLWTMSEGLTDVRGARFALARAIEKREPGMLRRVLDALEREKG